ncbi:MULTISPECIES: Na/Pi cotransporter family protein [Dictyoglomus]|jgi:phosphate:Na+ symporter|uniref:Na/Pi-cotransporter II-related protein n=1 Tax=Dictyoglomus turgidum (strain DSM 6724 / Z-1310) TaxID=515635 RepID=B8DYL3_DICTD|nr:MULTISPECIES: Na/Pi cotransporter family protein [Dictyoglomus]ACK41395.1 Na/Pi-cotransporter II-related protein [Dictyoglomus turgidum DSM 6724]HBU31600.1 Na/Pi cotransporter family protein [Dictyoglomus sp.]
MSSFPLTYKDVGLLFGGLGLFLYGILQMSSGFEKAVGSKLRSIFEKLNSSPFRGLLIGTLVTAIVQSSSAVTVLTVAFVNAGLLTLEGALGIIFGANIGTTITAQLVAFKLTDVAPYFLFLGFLLFFAGKRKYIRNIGEALIGFGMIFMGISLMDSSLHALRTWEPFHNAIISMGKNPVLGILVGAIITAIIQSSSVTTSIVVALAAKGAIDLTSAVPVILGANIGTCVTALLASIGTSISAKRAALAHLFFNVIGVVLIFPFLGIFERFVSLTSAEVARQVANAHTFFNVLWASIWIFFTKQYAELIKKVLPGEERIYRREASFLKPQLLNTPSAALEAAKNELIRMCDIVDEMYNLTMDSLFQNNTQHYKDILTIEDITDGLKASLINYLTQLSIDSLSEGEAKELNAILRAVDDVERIADHLTNVMEKVEAKNSERIEFTEYAWKDLEELRKIIYDNIRDSFAMIKESTANYLDEVLQREERIDYKVKESKESHIERMKKGICNPIAGVIFSDLLIDLERIGDHCVNIAQEFYEVNNSKREKTLLR